MKKKIKSFYKAVKHEIRSQSHLNKTNQIHNRKKTSSTKRLMVQRKFIQNICYLKETFQINRKSEKEILKHKTSISTKKITCITQLGARNQPAIKKNLFFEPSNLFSHIVIE